MGDDKPTLPRGCSLVDRGGCVTARCACDWFTTCTTIDQAIDAAFEHARTDAWCYVHRNLTPVGADPVTGGPRRERPPCRPRHQPRRHPMTDVAYRRYRLPALTIDGPDLEPGQPVEVTLYGDLTTDVLGLFIRVDDWAGPRPSDYRTRPAHREYRDVLVALFADPHHRATADSVLNELHQAGWRVVPRDASRVDARRIPAELLDVAGAEDLSGVHSDAEGSL